MKHITVYKTRKNGKAGKGKSYLIFDTGKKIFLNDNEKKEYELKIKEYTLSGTIN